jgi:hypothetical protein
VRGVCTGDRMGLDAFITFQEAILFSRRMGSGPWLFPLKEELMYDQSLLSPSLVCLSLFQSFSFSLYDYFNDDDDDDDDDINVRNEDE